MDMKQVIEIAKLAVDAAKTAKRDYAAKDAAKRQNDVEVKELHASIKQSVAADAVSGQRAEGTVADGQTIGAVAILSAEALRLRGLLIADMYNPQLRRLYLAARTSNEIILDEHDGRGRSSLQIFGTFIGGTLLGGIVGAFMGARRVSRSFLGMNVGSKTIIDWDVVLVCALVVGSMAAIVLAFFVRRHVGRLWKDFGPVPQDLQSRTSVAIRRKLFPPT